MYLIVAYDVPAKRTEKYRKLLSRYLQQLQYSVFAGDLTETTHRKLQRDLDALYAETDRLVFIQTANRRNIEVETRAGGERRQEVSHLGSVIA